MQGWAFAALAVSILIGVRASDDAAVSTNDPRAPFEAPRAAKGDASYLEALPSVMIEYNEGDGEGAESTSRDARFLESHLKNCYDRSDAFKAVHGSLVDAAARRGQPLTMRAGTSSAYTFNIAPIFQDGMVQYKIGRVLIDVADLQRFPPLSDAGAPKPGEAPHWAENRCSVLAHEIAEQAALFALQKDIVTNAEYQIPHCADANLAGDAVVNERLDALGLERRKRGREYSKKHGGHRDAHIEIVGYGTEIHHYPAPVDDYEPVFDIDRISYSTSFDEPPADADVVCR